MNRPREREAQAPRPRFGREDGQAMLFGVITLLFVFVLIFAVFRVGMVSHRRMEVQNAADLAAYAGANVEANNISMMAFINRGMAFIYYNLMRYAVDVAVFGTMKTYKDHDGFELSFLNIGYMGARTCPDDYIDTEGINLTGKKIGELYSDAKSNWDDDVPDGVDWIRDLYETNRGIADSTPLLVRREVYLVGTENGAVHVCMFPDAIRSAAPESSGFTMNFNPHQGEDGETSFVKHEKDLNRWAYKIAVDSYWPEPLTPHPFVKNEKIPDWFNAITGKPRSSDAYYQIRECWNKRDMDHDQQHWSYIWPWKMEPPGHFHHWHIHWKVIDYVTIPVAIHKNGHNYDDGHTTWWDYYTPFIPMPFPLDGYIHHAVLDCPTCFRFNLVKWDADGDLSTDIFKDLSDSDAGNRAEVPIRDGWPHQQPGQFAPPLVLDRAVFKYGINVGTWRPPDIRGGFLDDAEWGYFAVASAKVGFLRNGRVVVFRQDTRSAGDPNKDFDAWISSANNLYELQWGAKLVPVKDALYDKSTAVLFRGIAGGIWMNNYRDPVGNLSVNLKLATMPIEVREGYGPGSGFGTKQKKLFWNWYDSPGIEGAVRH